MNNGMYGEPAKADDLGDTEHCRAGPSKHRVSVVHAGARR